MAWHVAIVVDQEEPQETLHANLSILLGQMPVWAIAKSERIPGAADLRGQWESCWLPEPALTLVTPLNREYAFEQLLGLIPTLQEHHPRLRAVRLFGIDSSEQLTNELAELGFFPITGTSWDGLGFARSLSEIEGVETIKLDASRWQSCDDLYKSFFNAVGAPEWHGKNLDALNDSIGGGAINDVEVPYRIAVLNSSALDGRPEVLAELRDWEDLVSRLQANGCPVNMTLQR